MSRRDEDDLVQRFCQLVEMKLTLEEGLPSSSEEGASSIEEIDRQIQEIGRHWELDAEELEEAVGAIAEELRQARQEPSARSAPRPGAGGSLKAVALIMTWGVLFSGLIWSLNWGFESSVMVARARAQCQDIGFELDGLAREGRRRVGASCHLRAPDGSWETRVVRQGYLVDNLFVDQGLRSLVFVLILIVAIVIPSGLLYLVVGAFARKPRRGRS